MKSIRIPLLAALLAIAATTAQAHPGPSAGAANQDGARAHEPIDPRAQARWHARKHAHLHARMDAREHAQLHARLDARRHARLDADRDGAVSRAELDAANQRRVRMFERADADRDGKVSRQEMLAMRDAMRERATDRQGPGHGPMRDRKRLHHPGAAPAAPQAPATAPSGWAPTVDYLG